MAETSVSRSASHFFRGPSCLAVGSDDWPALVKIYVRLVGPLAHGELRCLMQTHETVTSFRKVTAGSNRKFGVAFGVLFAILGLWPLFRQASSPKWGLISLSAAFLAAALLRPHWLKPLNRAWFKLGLALSRIVNPVVMGLLFFGAVVPFGWFLRRKGEDLLRLKMMPQAGTYWIEREPPGPAPDSMKKQF
jgi:hypothetical protein